ncbi:ATP-binding protein [Govanella unica]|uniref:histidine kinase n=1 Tax=Govanella unica TaxID=2975056 RepID=A0A9X3Z8S6_9PROT|nr:sensor histidine kinase [Govania unica]MDA5195109.1 sensor histidine kinase [Govania unica]
MTQASGSPASTQTGDAGSGIRASQSLTARILIAAVVWLAIALAAGGFGLSYVFKSAVERNFDSRLSMLLDSLVGASNVDGQGIVSLYRSMMDPRFDRPYSGWYWRISAVGELPFRSRSLWDQDLSFPDARHLARAEFVNFKGPEAQRLRATARDIHLPGSAKTYRFMVAGDLSEVELQVRDFNRMLIWWLSALGGVLLATMAIQVRYGLMPLRTLSRKLSAIRSGRATRLEGPTPKEIMPLVTELNALIDHNAAVVERAQKHVGNLAHALKTPLTVMSNEADAQSSDLAKLVTRQTDIMRRHVDHHLARARAAARGGVIGSRSDVMPALRDLVRVIEKIYGHRGLKFSIVKRAVDKDLVFRGERQDLDDMLGNLLDNAGKWAKTRVRLTVGCDDGRLRIQIEDDGPGISEKDRALVFTRGERIDESVPGSGLGLGIVKDLAELCGGDVRLKESPLGGLLAELDLPRVLDQR